MEDISSKKFKENVSGSSKPLLTIREKLRLLPRDPGCYLFKDKYGKVIYVGKAKVLRNRVRSYFSGKSDGRYQFEKLVAKVRGLPRRPLNNGWIDRDCHAVGALLGSILANRKLTKRQQRRNASGHMEG